MLSGTLTNTGVELLGVRGIVQNRHIPFTIDSGASCNFIAMDLVRTLGLAHTIKSNHSVVRLADGKQL